MVKIRSPRSAINNAGVGYYNWSNPTIIYYSDNLYSTFSGNGRRSYYLYGYNFSFGIPTVNNPRIVGVELRIERKASINSDLNNVTDYSVRMYIPGIGWVGNNLKKIDAWGTGEQYISYGGSADTWGLSDLELTPEAVNDPNFGFGLSVDVLGNAIAYVDNYLVYVYYVEENITDKVLATFVVEGGIYGPLQHNTQLYWASKRFRFFKAGERDRIPLTGDRKRTFSASDIKRIFSGSDRERVGKVDNRDRIKNSDG